MTSLSGASSMARRKARSAGPGIPRSFAQAPSAAAAGASFFPSPFQYRSKSAAGSAEGVTPARVEAAMRRVPEEVPRRISPFAERETS